MYNGVQWVNAISTATDIRKLEIAKDRIRFLSSANEHTRLLERQTSRSTPRHRSPTRTSPTPSALLQVVVSVSARREVGAEKCDDSLDTDSTQLPALPAIHDEYTTAGYNFHPPGEDVWTGARGGLVSVCRGQRRVEKQSSSTSSDATSKSHQERDISDLSVPSGHSSWYEAQNDTEGDGDGDVDEIFNGAGG